MAASTTRTSEIAVIEMDPNIKISGRGEKRTRESSDSGRQQSHQTTKGSRGNFLSEIGVVEVTKLAGNYWRTNGFSVNARSFLYPEEALYLLEEKKISIEHKGVVMNLEQFYTAAIGLIPLQCYLTYVRLKSLEYIVMRHKKQVSMFGSDVDVKIHMTQHPDRSILDEMISFAVYPNTAEWKKSSALDIRPAAYVAVTNGEDSFSMQLTMELLRQANGVPVLFSIVSRSGFVFLEEFTDALQSLNWDLGADGRILTAKMSSPHQAVSSIGDEEKDDDEGPDIGLVEQDKEIGEGDSHLGFVDYDDEKR